VEGKIGGEYLNKNSKPQIDWFIFVGGTVVLLAAVVPIAVAPEWSIKMVAAAFSFLTQQFGVYYVIAACAILVFLLWVAISDFGGTVLGPTGVAPSHSKFSWAAMLFCTGIGSSLIYWGAAEWAFYYTSPPFGVEPRSDEAMLWASSYGMFHW